MSGKKVWQPHRSHLYQRLTIAGLHHDKVVIRVGLGICIVSFLAVFGETNKELFLQWILLLIAPFGFFIYWKLTCRYEKFKKTDQLIHNV